MQEEYVRDVSRRNAIEMERLILWQKKKGEYPERRRMVRKTR